MTASAFVSQRLGPNEFVIDDDNAHEHAAQSATMGRGREARDYSQVGYGALPGASKFSHEIIPRSHWPEMIRRQEETKTRNSDFAKRAGLKPLNQGRTNYCWCNAVVMAMMVVRAIQRQSPILLSPASVAAPIKGFRNVGGWGGEALDYIVENGVCPQSDWPPNAIDRSYFTADNKALAKSYRVTEWWELEPRRFEQLATCLLLNIPVPIGLNWWSHEICGMDLVVLEGGKFGVRILNSWGDGYGEDGYAILSESKATPDDAVAPRVATAA